MATEVLFLLPSLPPPVGYGHISSCTIGAGQNCFEVLVFPIFFEQGLPVKLDSSRKPEGTPSHKSTPASPATPLGMAGSCVRVSILLSGHMLARPGSMGSLGPWGPRWNSPPGPGPGQEYPLLKQRPAFRLETQRLLTAPCGALSDGNLTLASAVADLKSS